MSAFDSLRKYPQNAKVETSRTNTSTPVNVKARPPFYPHDKANSIIINTEGVVDKLEIYKLIKKAREEKKNVVFLPRKSSGIEADNKAKSTKPERPFGGVESGASGDFPNYDRRVAKANLRNNEYPRNVDINGVKDERFRIFEVVADGRCLFGAIWLLTQTPPEINRLLNDTGTYKDIEDFNDNGGLNAWIKTLFSSITKCQKIKMMEQHFLNSRVEQEQISKLIGEYKGDNHLMDVCNTDSPENQKKVGRWYEELSRNGVVGKFDQYLSSLYTNQYHDVEDFEPSYPYSDLSLLGDFLSDTLNININLVVTSGKIPYQGAYSIFQTYHGKPNRLKKNIYVYYKAAGHFQPMIPNSILDERNRGPPISAAISSIKTYDDLKTKFSNTFDAYTIRSVFEAQNRDIASTNNYLQEMIEGTAQPYAQELKQLIEMGFSEKEAMEGLDLSNGNVEQAFEILTQSEQPNSRRKSDASNKSKDYGMGAVSSTPKSSVMASTKSSNFKQLKDAFPDIDDNVIKTLLLENSNDFNTSYGELMEIDQGVENNKKIEKLTNMGYSREESMNALENANNNFEKALQFLTSSAPRASFDTQPNITRKDFREDRNEIRRDLPKNIKIEGIPSETFSLIEVVADGRCFFGSFWLLSLTPAEIRRYMTDPEGYEAMDNFVDNELSRLIKNEIFAQVSKCQKMTMMRTHYVDDKAISVAMAKIFKADGYSFLMDDICKAQEANLDPENLQLINAAYDKLTRQGFVRDFDKYLMSYYQSNNETYTDADPFLLGNFMSDLFEVNVNIVKNPPGNPSIYYVDSTFTGINGREGKEDIYIYFRSGHFQPMIPNSILKRVPPATMPQAVANVSSSKRKTQTPDEKTPIQTLMEAFPNLGENIITQVYEGNSKNFTNAYHALAEMEEEPPYPYASQLEQLKTFGFQENAAREALNLFNGDSNAAVEHLIDNNPQESKAPRNNSPTLLPTPPPSISSQGMFDTKNFIFKIPLKIKYALNNDWTHLKDLPSTGSGLNPFSKKYSTTNRIAGDADSVYSKTDYNLKNNASFKGKGFVLERGVEVCDGNGVSQPPENWKNATPDWYFRVNLIGNRVGGRTRKRPQKKRGPMRSQKKRKMRTRRCQTKRPRRRFSQTKHRKK